MQVKKLEGHGAYNLLGIDISRGKEHGSCGLNEGIFRYKYEEVVVQSQVTVMINTKIKIK